MMKSRSPFIVMIVFVSLLSPSIALAPADTELELYGTFHAMGVIVTIDSGDDPDQDAAANVAYRISGNGGPYYQAFPLSRISATRFVGRNGRSLGFPTRHRW